AADSYWEKKSKTAGLRATTNHLCDLNPEDAHEILRQAAEIFEGIGIINIAAQCFSDLGDHEKAGKHFKQRGMVPPFQPLSMAFSNINYYVDVPLAWSVDSIGWSKRGWKTTLMDVLAGRKTGGVVKVLLQLDPFLNELTIMFERSTETGSVWVTLKRSSLKPKAVRNKMAVAGEAIDYKCLIRFTNGKKTISTSVRPDRRIFLPEGLLDRSEIPPYLNGEVPGDYGYDPFGLSKMPEDFA
ncbi:hypothetical protein S245_040254, partial [Arachis hypogaea]